MRFNYLTKNILLGYLGLITIALVLIFISPILHLGIWWTFSLCIFALILYALLRGRAENFVSGLIGENDIDDELKNLGPNYFKINDFDTDRGNIDKIVVGPTGVWTIEVKNHKGHITFDGNVLRNFRKPFEKDFLKQAYAEAKTLQGIIKSKLNIDIDVQPVLVFSNRYAKVKFGLNKVNGVFVVQKAWLNKLLRETHAQGLDGLTVLKIKKALETK